MGMKLNNYFCIPVVQKSFLKQLAGNFSISHSVSAMIVMRSLERSSSTSCVHWICNFSLFSEWPSQFPGLFLLLT